MVWYIRYGIWNMGGTRVEYAFRTTTSHGAAGTFIICGVWSRGGQEPLRAVAAAVHSFIASLPQLQQNVPGTTSEYRVDRRAYIQRQAPH